MREDFKLRHKNNFYQEVTALGGYVFCILVFLFFLLEENSDVVKRLFLGFVFAYLITIAIRTFFYKDRPEKFNHSSYLERLDAASFPSLHAARSTLVFLIIADYTGNPVIFVLSVFLILLIGYSRTKLNRHDWKDVLSGIVLGLIAFIIL